MLVSVPDKFLLKNIITDEQHLYKTGQIEIDDCLVNEIVGLWLMGIHTRGCCCGHNKLTGYIEVERTDIPKMIAHGYKFFTEKEYNDFDTFVPKSECKCECCKEGDK